MIEFIKENKEFHAISFGAVKWEVWLASNPKGTAYLAYDLCDALWQAVKEILEK